MFFRLFNPSLLFFFGYIQAISPYFFRIFGSSEFDIYGVEPTYLPLYIWTTAFIAFALGVKISGNIAGIVNYRSVGNPKGIKKLRLIILLLAGALIFEIIWSIQLYGSIPILSFITGYDISMVNERQQDSSYGQLGLLTLSVFTLNGIIALYMSNQVKSKKIFKIILYFSLILIIFASIYQGKRQGLFINICLAAFCSTAITNNPFNGYLKMFDFAPKSNKKTLFYVLISIFIAIIFIGYISKIRIGDEVDSIFMVGFNEVARYLSFPLINFETQVLQSGLGPGSFSLLAVFGSFIPSKSMEQFSDLIPSGGIPSAEPTAGSGFIGVISWYLGLPGVVFFCLIFGYICGVLYRKSRLNRLSMLIYGQVVWTLVAAHSYNHFLNLIFIPLPALIFFIIYFILYKK